MEPLKDIISIYSTEELGPKILEEKSAETRDHLKGQMLAFNDFQSILKVYEDKGLGKMKEYIERFDPYAENLNLLINVYEPRAEAVISSKIKALILLKSNVLAYIEMQPAEINDNTTTPDGEDKVEEVTGAEAVESEISKKPKRGN